MTPDAAVLLLSAVTVVTQMVLPVGAYLALKRRASLPGKIWLWGMTCWFIAGTLTALRPWLDRYWGHELVWFFLSMTSLFAISYFRLQLDPDKPVLSKAWAITVALLILSTASAVLKWPVHYGFIWVSLLIPIGTAYMFGLVWQIRRRHRRKSLILMLIVLAAFGLSALPRLVAFLFSGQPEIMDIFRFGLVANVFTLVNIVGPIFLSLAYWMYVLEESNDEGSRARELLADREQMLLDSVGVSGQSMVSSFAAMVIHEFGSILQSLRLNLGSLREYSNRHGLQADITRPLDRLEDGSREATDLLNTLRTFVLRAEPTQEVVYVKDCLADVIAISATQARSKSISLELDYRLPEDQKVTANAVMLQRVLLNVLKNSLESLATHTPDSPTVQVLAERRWRESSKRHCMVIQIQDNGRGYPAALLDSLGRPWRSQKPAGMGLGLLLSKNLLELWGGDLEIRNREAPAMGAQTMMWLRCDQPG